MHQREMSLAPICVGWRSVWPSAIAVAAVITTEAANRRIGTSGVQLDSFMGLTQEPRSIMISRLENEIMIRFADSSASRCRVGFSTGGWFPWLESSRRCCRCPRHGCCRP